MDALTGRFQHAGDWVLGEPVDLQVGMQLAQHQPTARVLGQGDPAGHGTVRVFLTVDDQHRAADPPCQLARLLRPHEGRQLGERQPLGRGVQAPADAVLDRLGEVRLGGESMLRPLGSGT
jgi:hypothetical protein